MLVRSRNAGTLLNLNSNSRMLSASGFAFSSMSFDCSESLLLATSIVFHSAPSRMVRSCLRLSRALPVDIMYTSSRASLGGMVVISSM